MKDGFCPKCNSGDVFHKRAGLQTTTSAEAIIWRVAFGTRATPTVYTCADCGYSELYVDNPAERDDIRQHWYATDEKEKPDDF